MKRKDRNAQQVKEAYIAAHQDTWFTYFREDIPLPQALIPCNREEVQGVEDIFFVYLQNLKTPTIMNKISQFSNQHLSSYYKKELHSKRWSHRMNAMQRILDFQVDRLVDDCIQKDHKKLSPEEAFLLLKLMANLKDDEFMAYLKASSHVFSENEYKRICMDLRSEIFEALLNNMEDLPLVCRYALIDLIGLKRDSSYLSYLQEFLQSSDQEIRIRALKALYEIGVVVDIENYVKFSESSVWEERLMFTKLLFYLPSEIAMPYLRNLMKDEAWAVRLQAGRVISKYKDGKGILQDIIANETDPFAIDMANAFLEEGDQA